MSQYEDENPIDPGADPTGNPLGKYDIEFDSNIKAVKVTRQCTWANCFTEPVWDRGLCIISYDNAMELRNGCKDAHIATTTGNYYVANDETVWLECDLKYCNRRPTGWFRERDIWHSKKGVVKPDNGVTPPAKKNINWLAWLTGGAAVLRLFT